MPRNIAPTFTHQMASKLLTPNLNRTNHSAAMLLSQTRIRTNTNRGKINTKHANLIFSIHYLNGFFLCFLFYMRWGGSAKSLEPKKIIVSKAWSQKCHKGTFIKTEITIRDNTSLKTFTLSYENALRKNNLKKNYRLNQIIMVSYILC